MRWFKQWLSCMLLLMIGLSTQADSTLTIPSGSYVVLTFHDIRDDVVDEIDRDPYAIRTSYLARFFDWMKQNNWHPVSLQQIIDAQQGKHTLPDNAVLLTFDDGVASHYTKLFPLLKNYHYPALLALVTNWLGKDRATAQKAYGYDGFLTWDQIKEMQGSGLVEFATHSHDMHKGILANPQGNLEPAAITHLYHSDTGQYETTQAFLARVKSDLQTSVDIITAHTGVKPRAVVWPYGAVSPQVHAVAIAMGIPFSFSLAGADAKSHRLDETGVLSRLIVTGNPPANGLWQTVKDQLVEQPEPQRALRVTLDQVYSRNTAQFDRNVNQLLDQVKALHINRVYLTPWAAPVSGAKQLESYFSNRVIPIRQDIFNRVSWQLRTRAAVNVYVDLSSLNQAGLDVQQQYNLLEDLVGNASGISGALVQDDAQNLFSKRNPAALLLQVMRRGVNISNRFAVVQEVVWQPAHAAVLEQQLPTLARNYDELMVSLPILQGKDRQQLRGLIHTVQMMPKGQYKVVFNTTMPTNQQQYSRLYDQFMFLINQGMISLSYQSSGSAADIAHFGQLFQGLSLNAYPYYYRAPKLKQVSP